MRDKDGNLTVDSHDKAEVLNEFFGSVFTVDDGICPEFDLRVDNAINLSHITFTPNKVYDTLRCLKSTTSAGPDGIPNILLKTLCSQLALPLCHIYTISFNSQQVPDDWKHANVKPLFKQGVASDPNNYRPISLTSTCCRVMERIINKELLDYLLDNSLITKQQHGFIRYKSTCGNLLECLQDWVLSIDNKRVTDVIYIDFKKAFDRVSHKKLLLKLSSYDITADLEICTDG